MKIRKGDTVKVLYGKDASKTGVVLTILKKKDMVLVSGVNKVTKHIKGDGKTRKSEIVTVERPMPVAKVMLISPETNKPTRVGIVRKGKGYARLDKKSGKEISAKKEVKEVKKETKSKKETK